MSGLFGVIIGLFVIIGGPLLFFIADLQTKKVYKRKKRKFYALSKTYFDVKNHVTNEADRWPIYARPLLFTEIDHTAQIEFAKAQQALVDADQIFPQIETIDKLKIDEQFAFTDLFNILKNRNMIKLRSQLIRHVNALEEKIANIQNSLKSLRANRHHVEKKRLQVEKSIKELKVRTEQVHRRIKPMDVWKSIEAHNFTWVLMSANRCESEASNGVLNYSDYDQGYIEYATADIFVNIGNFSLDCIELFLESQSISRRYQLDQFFKLFNESTSFLKYILEMDEVWSGWKRLKGVKPFVDQLPWIRQDAEKSLRSFKNRQTHFEWLILLISRIDVESEIEFAEALEKECTYYWYSYAERAIYWEKALGSPPRFPVSELNRFHTQLVAEINPQIDVDTTIKQSQILGLMKKVGLVLEWHTSIENLLLMLNRELDDHKEAQRIVDEVLDSQGEATRIFNELKIVLTDTSPKISEWGLRLENHYEGYLIRAKRIRGADFPQLLNRIDQFILEAEKLISAHNLQMGQLNTDYKRFYEEIYALNKELVIYMEHVPKFDLKSIKMFSDAFEESIEILNESKIESYSWLRPATNQMQAWIENSGFSISQARDKYAAFLEGRLKVQQLILQTKVEIDTKREDTQNNWIWYKFEIMPRIKTAIRSYDHEKREWNRLVERNWTDYNINRAIAKCENLIKIFEKIQFDLDQEVEKFKYKQVQLDNKVKDIKLLLRKNSLHLQQQDQRDIKDLVDIAQKSKSYDYADRSLNYAHRMAMRRANSQIRSEARQIINNFFTDGGPVFTGIVDNRGGEISGRTR